MATTPDSKEQIFAAFGKILAAKEKIDSQIATKEETAEKARNKQILEVASTYTVDSIVKELADLQLEFGSIVNGLSEKLATKAAKLEQLGQAINTETQNLQELQQIRVVADALHLLNQGHQEKLKALRQTHANQRQALAKDMAEKRKVWAKDQAAFEHEVQAQEQLLTQTRQRQEADYQYDLQRQRTIEMNEYEEQQRTQEKELHDTNQANEKDGSEREKILVECQPLLKEYQQKASSFSTELDEAVEQARTAEIQAVNREAEVKAELLEKEWEATKQGYEFTIQSLEQNIQNQGEQIENLYNQLQETLNQSHTLTIKAFENSSSANPGIV
ncbi:MAG: hypothetical protein F6K19_16605 [Cyanothece sp. SIO1E1]|nr:hypothetical protein [Cyanothece sp. SIO1E1]